ncbi:MAG TPA: hypothetical protein VMU87_16435 [Stellaceae bacterium]|nr:hypothetical protein [Stellaceae bacterium]
MKPGDHVVYVGPDPIFRDLRGILVETEDRATRKPQWHFQPESNAIRPVPCLAEHVRVIRSGA